METLKNFEELEQDRKTHTLRLLQESRNSYEPAELYQQALDLETTLISESLDGQNRTDFDFDVRNGELYVLQPNGVVDWLALHENGSARAQRKAQDNPDFGFYARIAEAELAEARQQQELAADGRPVTMFALSLCGDDVAGPEALKVIGRHPDKQRAYLRASVFDGQRLRLHSCSIDGLGVEDARDLYSQFFNVNLPVGSNSLDILRGRVVMDGDRQDLIAHLTDETHQFVLEQEDLLNLHMANLQSLVGQDLPGHVLAAQAERHRYNILSSFKQRYEGSWTDTGDLASSVSYAGTIEQAAGTEFYGCVAVTAENNLDRAGYVNANRPETYFLKKDFDSEYCPCCLPKPRFGKKIRAWRQGDRIGCYDCGQEQDVCTKKVIRRGRSSDEKSSFWFW